MNKSAFLLIISLFCSSAAAFASEAENRQIKCAEFGRKFSADFKKEYVSEVSIWGNPEFHYNYAMDTCLVYTEIVDGVPHKNINQVWYHRRITDVYSNKVIIYSRYFIDKNDTEKKENLVNLVTVGNATNLSSSIFAVKKTELFAR